MPTIARYCLCVFALAAMLAGCGEPSWKPFDEIQVGRPLPSTLPGMMHRTALGAGYIGPHSGSGSSFGSSTRVVGVIADSDDLVTARACLTVSTANRLVYEQTSYRYVIEADPAFRPGRASDGKVRDELKLVAAISQRVAGKPAGVSSLSDRQSVAPIARAEVDRCISLMAEAVAETRGETGLPGGDMMEHMTPAASSRLSRGPGESLAINMAGREIQDRLAGLPASSGGPRRTPFTPSSVSEAMVYNHILLNTLSRPASPQDAAGAARALQPYLLHAHADVLGLLADPETYPSSLTVGYEKKWRTLGGVTVRLSIPAGGRLKLEISGSVVREPVMTE